MRPLVKYINKGLLTNTPIHLLHIQEKGEKIQSQKVGMDRIAVLPDIRPTRYPPFSKPDTGYFNACSLFDRVTQIIETSQIFKQE